MGFCSDFRAVLIIKVMRFRALSLWFFWFAWKNRDNSSYAIRSTIFIYDSDEWWLRTMFLFFNTAIILVCSKNLFIHYYFVDLRFSLFCFVSVPERERQWKRERKSSLRSERNIKDNNKKQARERKRKRKRERCLSICFGAKGREKA